MTDNANPLVYVILGASGSGRRGVVADLIDGGLRGPEARVVTLQAEGEASAETDARLESVVPWRLVEEQRIEAELPEGTTHAFFITDGRANPVDQLEALKPWLASQGAELARVICVVHCQLAEAHPELLAWYDACIHFADAVLLNRREGVANKWLSDFQARYKDQFYPCVFEFVKDGRVKNPPLILEPEARRITHYFDEETDWVIQGVEGEDEADMGDEDAEVTITAAEDPYFERFQGGRRVKVIPQIASFLPDGRVPS